MNAAFHIVGCALADEPDAAAIDECVDWIRRYGARVLAQDDRRAVFVQFDATAAQLVLYGCRAALARRPPLLRFGYASAVKEGGPDGQPRAGERGVAQAVDLASAALPGQVLLSSQLASLLQVAEVEPHQRLRQMRVSLADGRTATAFQVEPLRGAAVAQ